MQVLVKDLDGLAVAGADVTFSVLSGGGNLRDDSQVEVQSVTVQTDWRGIASADLSTVRMSTRTLLL